jgi:hypothetical protein
MSVIERPLDTPTVEEIPVRRPTKQEILRHAERVLERDGWTRAVTTDSEGRVCLLGAIARAGSELGDTVRSINDADPERYAYTYVESVTGADSYDIYRFNDDLHRRRGLFKSEQAKRRELIAYMRGL